MKIRIIIKRIASATMALAIGATAIATSFSGVDFTANAADEKFSITVSKDNYGFWHYTGFPEIDSLDTTKKLSAFCYSYSKHAWSGDTYTESSVSYDRGVELYLGLVQYYGYPNADTSDAYFGATQCLVWEIINGYRTLDNNFTRKGDGYYGLIYNQTQKNAYNYIVNKVRNHHATMSCAGQTLTLKFNPAKKRYETTITDSYELGGAFNFVTKLRGEGFTVEQTDSKHYTVATTAPINSAKSVSFKKTIPFRYKQTKITYVCAGTINGRPTQDNQIMGLQNYIDPTNMVMAFVTEKTGNLSFDKRFLNTDGSVTDEYYVKQNGLYSKVKFTLKENKTGENVYLKGSNGSYTFVGLNHTAGVDFTGSTATIKVNSTTGNCSLTGLPVGNYTLIENLDTTENVDFLLSQNIAISVKAGETTEKVVDNKSEKGYYGVSLVKHWVDENGNDYSSANAEDYKKLLDTFKEDADADYSNAFSKTEALFNSVSFVPYVVVNNTKYYLNRTGGKQLSSTNFNGWIITNTLGQDDSVMMSANMAGICPHKEDAIELSFGEFGRGSDASINISNGTVNELPSLYVYGLTKDTGVLPIDTDHWHYSKGQIGVNGTTDGKIYFEEIAADKTYAAVPQNVDSLTATAVDFTRSDTVDVYNYKRVFPLNVVKKDSVTGAPVQNAKYGLYNKETNEKLDEGVTDENGSITFENLAVDKTYYVKEIQAPDNYVLDTKSYDVKFTGSLDGLELTQRVLDVQKLEIKETPKLADLNIEKKDDLGNIVANVTFDVTTNQNIVYNNKSYNKGAVVTTLTTDENGKANVKGLPLGEYTVKETGKYNPYVVSNEEQTVTFNGADVAATVQYVSKTLEFTNYIQKGKLTIKKVATFDNTKTLAGAEFTVTAAEDFVVNGHKLHSKGDVIATLVTDDKGIATNYKEVDVTVEEIPMYVGAEYTVTEIKAPEGYTLDNTPKSFIMKWDDTPELRYVSETQVFGNAENSGSIQVSKRTEGNFNIANIKFNLSGTSTQGQTVSQSATTDENGVALFTSVPVGTYEIVEDGETVPTAYLVAESKKNVKVEYAKTTNVVFYNTEKEGSVTVQKHTKGDLNISGITFNLKGQSESGRDISVSATTDENGVAKFTNVPIGVYEITEDGQTVPTAYMVAGKKNVKVEYAQTANVQFTNEEKTGAIELQKRTEGNLNISGINFVLKGTADTGEYVEITATTDENGVAKFDKIPVGSAYEIVEDGDSVPTAYLVAESKKDVKVEYAKTTNVEIVNEERTGSIALQKKTKDMTNIKGIRFVLSGKADCGRDVRIEAITDDKGVATFNDVPIGTFVISEDGSTVPTGYLVADNQTVKVEYAKTSNVTFVNEEKPNTPPDTPPQTGYNEFNPMVVALLAGIALIGIFSIYVKIAKKKEEK